MRRDGQLFQQKLPIILDRGWYVFSFSCSPCPFFGSVAAKIQKAESIYEYS